MTETERGADTPPVSLETWLGRLRAAAGLDADLTISASERQALLELARVSAHTSERIAAPLATFLVGIACAHLPVAERAEFVRRITASLITPAG